MDHFSVLLTKSQTAVASTDSPQTLSETEQMLNQYQSIKEEIDRYAPDYSKMRDYGDRVCNNADTADPQYLFLRERLNALNLESSSAYTQRRLELVIIRVSRL